MILSDQAAVVLNRFGRLYDCDANWADWSDAHTECAKRIGGYVVQANSDPEHVFEDYRDRNLLCERESPDSDGLITCILPAVHDGKLHTDGCLAWCETCSPEHAGICFDPQCICGAVGQCSEHGHLCAITYSDGTYTVTCRLGCNLGTSAEQPSESEARNRAELHKLATHVGDVVKQRARKS